MEIRIEYINHEQAKEMVEKCPQEPNEPEKVKVYSELMNDGEWVNANEHHMFRKQHYCVPIIITEDDVLWEGKHRIFALAKSVSHGYRFVVIRGWSNEKATQEYQEGEKKFCRWGYLVYAMHKLSGNGNEPTKLEDL